MKSLSKQDILYNALLRTLKEYGSDATIWDIKVAINRLGQDVCSKMSAKVDLACFSEIAEDLREKEPRDG